MILIRPFKGLRPQAKYAAEVLAPPYDVLSTQEAREQAAGRPWSFLHISKPEIDLPSEVDPYSDAVYRQGAKNLQAQIDNEILLRDQSNSYYFYRLTMGEHQQTGLVAVASVEAYLNNIIKKHEFTRPQKEDDRVKQIDSLNAQTGPVFLTYKYNAQIDELVASIVTAEPVYDVTAADGIRHEFWRVSDSNTIDKISALFNALPNLYIADGHHRSAAAARVAKSRQQAGDKGHASQYFLSVLFPDKQMFILDYNRVVRDLNGLSVPEFLTAIEKNFVLEKQASAYKPKSAGEFGMYVNSHWYKLSIKLDRNSITDPVKQLDISLLADYLIEPILAISDPRRDDRIDFVGGIRGLHELEKRVNSGEMAVAFALYPTQLSQLMQVADAGQVMPPKSTWFEPKLADGLVSHVLDE